MRSAHTRANQFNYKPRDTNPLLGVVCIHSRFSINAIPVRNTSDVGALSSLIENFSLAPLFSVCEQFTKHRTRREMHLVIRQSIKKSKKLALKASAPTPPGADQRGRALLSTGSPAQIELPRAMPWVVRALPKLNSEAAKRLIFRCGGAVQAPEELPFCPGDTVWVISLLGYTTSADTFEKTLALWLKSAARSEITERHSYSPTPDYGAKHAVS